MDANPPDHRETRSDSGRAVVDALRRYVNETDLYVLDAGREHELHPTDLACLGALRVPTDGLPGPMTPGRLSAALGLSPSATSALLDRLEAKGLVRRSRSPRDGRRVEVEVTPRAVDVTTHAIEPLGAQMSALLVTRDDAELDLVAAFVEEAIAATRRARSTVAARTALEGSGEAH